MNIYKTKKSGLYINMDMIRYVHVITDNTHYWDVTITFSETDEIQLHGDQGRAFLDYVNYHLGSVYEGSA